MSFESPEKREMSAADVVEFHARLKTMGIDIWIDGGWGVDALLGQQTRDHGDLDIAIQQKDLKKALEMLEIDGYREVRRGNEWNFVMADGKGHEIDFHAFVFDEDGHVTHGIKYPDGALTGSGIIDGHTVKCISPEHMVRFHTGYTLRASDFKDVAALCERYGIEYPAEYAHLKKGQARRDSL